MDKEHQNAKRYVLRCYICGKEFIGKRSGETVCPADGEHYKQGGGFILVNREDPIPLAARSTYLKLDECDIYKVLRCINAEDGHIYQIDSLVRRLNTAFNIHESRIAVVNGTEFTRISKILNRYEPRDFRFFIAARKAIFPKAVADMQSGILSPEWINLIFPIQLTKDEIPMNEELLLILDRDVVEFAHNKRLTKKMNSCCSILLDLKGETLEKLRRSEYIGWLRSSMKLFYGLTYHPLYREVLRKCCGE